MFKKHVKKYFEGVSEDNEFSQKITRRTKDKTAGTELVKGYDVMFAVKTLMFTLLFLLYGFIGLSASEKPQDVNSSLKSNNAVTNNIRNKYLFPLGKCKLDVTRNYSAIASQFDLQYCFVLCDNYEIIPFKLSLDEDPVPLKSVLKCDFRIADIAAESDLLKGDGVIKVFILDKDGRRALRCNYDTKNDTWGKLEEVARFTPEPVSIACSSEDDAFVVARDDLLVYLKNNKADQVLTAPGGYGGGTLRKFIGAAVYINSDYIFTCAIDRHNNSIVLWTLKNDDTMECLDQREWRPVGRSFNPVNISCVGGEKSGDINILDSSDNSIWNINLTDGRYDLVNVNNYKFMEESGSPVLKKVDQSDFNTYLNALGVIDGVPALYVCRQF